MTEDSGTIRQEEIDLSYHAVFPDFYRQVFVIVHGLSEHKGRYRRLQEDLAREGYASYAYDQRGFGQSGGSRTDVRRYTDYHLDLKKVIQFVRARHPDRKVILLGHSFGGMVSATYCIGYPNTVDGLVLSAPAYDLPVPPFYIRVLGPLLRFFLPTILIRYPSQSDHLSHDPAVGPAFRNDPLAQRAGTPRFYVELRRMNRYFHRFAERITLPTLILQGSEDRIVIPSGAKGLYQKIGGSKKKLIWYDRFYHEVFNEIERERVIADLIEWLKETV